jgi:hypothetical protein
MDHAADIFNNGVIEGRLAAARTHPGRNIFDKHKMVINLESLLHAFIVKGGVSAHMAF